MFSTCSSALPLIFQVIDNAALKPVHQADLGLPIAGICVTRQWPVVSDYNDNVIVYSLPDLQLQDQVQVNGRHPRADSGGMVHLAGDCFISMLEISNTGNVSVQGRLTAGGRLRYTRAVAFGPQPGQLCAGHNRPPAVYIIDIKNDRIEQTLELPSGIDSVWFVATLGSGQILVADGGGNLAWYRSVSKPAVLFTDTPVTGQRVAMLMNINQFLVAPLWGSQLYVMDSEGGWHTVDPLKWETGVWLPYIMDVAVWENCVWVVNYYGSLVLLCPV